MKQINNYTTMTLKTLYSRLSKIIDDNISSNSDILDYNVVINVMPHTCLYEDMVRSGIFPISSLSLEDNIIIISNS